MAFSGMTYLWRDPEVERPGAACQTAFPDYVAPSYGALAILAALHTATKPVKANILTSHRQRPPPRCWAPHIWNGSSMAVTRSPRETLAAWRHRMAVTNARVMIAGVLSVSKHNKSGCASARSQVTANGPMMRVSPT